MGSLADLRIKISAVADAIRSKLGIEDGLTLDEMAAAIDNIGGSFPLQEKEVTTNGEVIPDEGYYGLSKVIVNISTGGGGSENEGVGIVPNGYVIHFYDYNNELIESHSAKINNWIDKPISFTPVNWQNSQGYVYSFPLKVEEGMETTIYLYPNDEDLEEAFYAWFTGREDYPYFIIDIHDNGNSHSVNVTVIRTYQESSYGLRLGQCTQTNSFSIGEYIPIGDVRRAINECITRCQFGIPGNASMEYNYSTNEKRFYCANFTPSNVPSNWYTV